MARKAADGRGVRAPVVVDDDDQVRRLEVGNLVQGLVSHAAGQRTVSDHRDHMAAHALAQPRFGDTQRVAQGRRRVAVLDEVVLRFFAGRISGQAAGLAEPREIARAPRDDLVDVCLVAGVPDDRVLRAFEHSMQRKGELDHAEVRRQMPARTGGLLDQEGAHLFGELRQMRLVQLPKVSWGFDSLEDSHLNA